MLFCGDPSVHKQRITSSIAVDIRRWYPISCTKWPSAGTQNPSSDQCPPSLLDPQRIVSSRDIARIEIPNGLARLWSPGCFGRGRSRRHPARRSWFRIRM